jgi:hypothetical protein
LIQGLRIEERIQGRVEMCLGLGYRADPSPLSSFSLFPFSLFLLSPPLKLGFLPWMVELSLELLEWILGGFSSSLLPLRARQVYDSQLAPSSM